MNAAAVDTPSRRGHGAASSASEVLARLEEQYNVVLDKEFGQLTSNFVEMVRVAKLGDDKTATTVQRESLAVDVHASNIVAIRSAQNLLTLIAGLKQSALINDQHTALETQRVRSDQEMDEVERRTARIQELRACLSADVLGHNGDVLNEQE